MTPAANNILFCWEQVDQSNGLFRLSRIFAPPGARDRLLPLYALFAVIDAICNEVGDDEVVLRKLEWWRQECLQPNPAGSSHPVLRELVRTGAMQRCDRDGLAELFDSARTRMAAESPATMDDLGALCRMLGYPRLELEAAVAGDSPEAVAGEAALAAANGLTQLLRGSAEMDSWWLPLDLQSRDELHCKEKVSMRRVACRILGEIIGAEGLPGGGTQRRIPLSLRHAVVLHALEIKRLKPRRKAVSGGLATELNRPRSSDLLTAWRAARAVSRR